MRGKRHVWWSYTIRKFSMGGPQVSFFGSKRTNGLEALAQIPGLLHETSRLLEGALQDVFLILEPKSSA